MTWALNILLPGAGLICLGREWLGFALCLLFGMSVNLALAGYFIAPAGVPLWLSRLSVVMAILSWGLSQYLMWRNTGNRRSNADGPSQ